MPKISLSSIKTIFSTGNRPTQTDYANTFDSFVHIDNQAAVNGQIVDQKIANYDTALKGRNSNAIIDSLGDLFAFVAGYADTVVLKTIIENLIQKATWAQLPNKPTSVALTWTEQIVDTTVTVPLPATGQTTQSWLCLPRMDLAGKGYVVIDMKVARTAYQPPSGGILYYDQIIMVKLAVSPTTSFA